MRRGAVGRGGAGAPAAAVRAPPAADARSCRPAQRARRTCRKQLVLQTARRAAQRGGDGDSETTPSSADDAEDTAAARAAPARATTAPAPARAPHARAPRARPACSGPDTPAGSEPATPRAAAAAAAPLAPPAPPSPARSCGASPPPQQQQQQQAPAFPHALAAVPPALFPLVAMAYAAAAGDPSAAERMLPRRGSAYLLGDVARCLRPPPPPLPLLVRGGAEHASLLLALPAELPDWLHAFCG